MPKALGISELEICLQGQLNHFVLLCSLQNLINRGFDIFFSITLGSTTSEYNVLVLFSLGLNVKNIRQHQT